MNAGDIYGGDTTAILGVKETLSASDNSGSIGTLGNFTNSSFSWLAFVLMLVFIRLLEMSAKTV